MINPKLLNCNSLPTLLAIRRGKIGHLDTQTLKPIRDIYKLPKSQILQNIEHELHLLQSTFNQLTLKEEPLYSLTQLPLSNLRRQNLLRADKNSEEFLSSFSSHSEGDRKDLEIMIANKYGRRANGMKVFRRVSDDLET